MNEKQLQMALGTIDAAASRLRTIDPRYEDDLDEEDQSQGIATRLDRVWELLQEDKP